MAPREERMKGELDPNEVLSIHMITDGPSSGWVHTHGMSDPGHPELEVRGIPKFLMPAAGRLLNELADIILNSGETFKTGDTCLIGRSIFRIVEAKAPIPEEQDHYDVPVWRLVDVDDLLCSFCKPVAQ